MTDLKQIELLNKAVQNYYKISLQDGNGLNELLQKITGLLYYLETVRANTHNLYESKIQEIVKSGESVSRATNEANVAYPEMYMLRRVMDAGYRVVDAIRTNISFLKEEMKNIKTQ
jgi:uncharacterized protein YicC (UPF0701 family)